MLLMNRAKITVGALCFLISFSALSTEEVYKWTDKNGLIHYGDSKPTEALKADELKITGNGPSASSDTTEQADSSQKQPTDSDKNNDSLDDPEQKLKQKKKLEASCKQAKGNLAMLSSGARLRMKNDKGEPVPIDEEKREAEIKRSKTFIDVYCSDVN